MRCLHILGNTGIRLIAEQTPYNGYFLTYIAILFAAGFLIRYLWSRRFKLAALPGSIIIFLLLDFLMPTIPTYTLTLNREARTINSEARVKNTVQSRFTVAASDLNSAEMQFNRGAITIVLVRRDGSLLYPLGEQQLQDEPDQYVVSNAIRKMIGEVPQPAPSQ